MMLLVLLCCGILTLWVPGPWALAAFQCGVFIAGLLWIRRFALRRVPLLTTPALFPLAAAVLWPLFQLAANRSIYRWETSHAFWTWLANLTVFFLAVQLASQARPLRRFLTALLWFACGLSAVATLGLFTSDGKIFWLFPSGYTDYVLGPFVYRNQYAAFVELLLPVALCLALFAKKNRLGYAIAAAAMLGSAIASASRAGAVLAIAEVVAMPLLASALGLASRRSAGTVLGATLGFAVLAVLVVGVEPVWQRFLSPDPYFLRREVNEAGLAMFRAHPLTGFGLGTWATAYPAHAVFDPGAAITEAHNDWLQWAVEGGAPLLLFMLAFAALLIRPAVRSLWGVGVLAVLLHCLVDYPLSQRPQFAALFFAMAGALAASTVNVGASGAPARNSEVRAVPRRSRSRSPAPAG
jgi:O-antigen polymerase